MKEENDKEEQDRVEMEDEVELHLEEDEEVEKEDDKERGERAGRGCGRAAGGGGGIEESGRETAVSKDGCLRLYSSKTLNKIKKTKQKKTALRVNVRGASFTILQTAGQPVGAIRGPAGGKKDQQRTNGEQRAEGTSRGPAVGSRRKKEPAEDQQGAAEDQQRVAGDNRDRHRTNGGKGQGRWD